MRVTDYWKICQTLYGLPRAPCVAPPRGRADAKRPGPGKSQSKTMEHISSD